MEDIKYKINPVSNIQWQHAISDNTFGEELSKELDNAFINWEEKGYVFNEEVTNWSGIMFFPDTSRFNHIVNKVWDNTKDSPSFNKNARDYMVVLELNIMKPNTSYHYHCDVDRKQFTGVCYWRQGKDGTILKSGNQRAKVGWRHNRAVWFANVTDKLWQEDKVSQSNPIVPWHTFENSSDKPRYTVNINYTPRSYIKEILREKNAQFLHYMNNNEVKWLPLVKNLNNKWRLAQMERERKLKNVTIA
jgi:hypothetical protein